MMTCSQDNYYTTAIVAPGDTCGACGGIYKFCQPTGSSGSGQPSCCPTGYTFTGDRSNCGACQYGILNTIGTKYMCTPDQPQMNQTAQLNCCLNQNLPNNNPNGYCSSGWCSGSSKCDSFLTDYCKGDKLQTDECKQFCRNNLGKCDSALIKYCSDPTNFKLSICGCALPSDQYFLSNLKTPDGETIPIACDRRCGINVDAIKLLGQQDCNIDAICVVNLNDVNIIAKEVDPKINIVQNCGLKPPTPVPSDNTYTQIIKKYWYMFLIIFVVIIIIMVVAVLI